MDGVTIERDLDVLRDGGFNTLTVWRVDFKASGGAGARWSVADMVRIAGLARERGLFVRFYLNVHRFVRLFPRVTLADRRRHRFNIGYGDPGYRAFARNLATGLATAWYPFENVSTVVVWAEKISLDIERRGWRRSMPRRRATV